MAASLAPQDKPANAFVERGKVAKFAATSTFKLQLPKGDHAVLTDPGVRFLDADGKVVGGMTRLDIRDTAGNIHKATWTLKGDQVTQTIADVKEGSTIEGTVVRPTAPGQITTRMDWTCFMDGVGALGGGIAVAASVAGGLETGGASLAATGGLINGTAGAAKGVADHCF
ncbi:hypothetical protein GCM10010289_21790 [Streptomyces violascens]|uniref:Uncharacterized protein n=2 Tax=Streptomyces violascens TaxID=67381 RepID=A0ABQ3QEJ1_9ACTN|nr:hypothetical protein GCM10010289_21790 [Streptomyces violascens]GHI35693.1 hypothetical protein Sviol_01010 [Streptomyces violascens]